MVILPLISLLLAHFSKAAVLEHQLVWKESKMVEMIRNGEYPAYLEYRDRMVAMRGSNLASVVQSTTDYVYYEYMGNITVGTPDQNFIVVLDTGSANLLIPGTNCTTYCEKKRLFNEKASSTYIATNRPWQIKYASGDAYGTLGLDTVKIGGSYESQLAIPNSYLGVADTVGSDFKWSPKEGIFGLAFTALAVDNITPPLINAINQKLLDQPIFTIWFDQRGAPGTSAGGAFTYGALDTTHCGPVIGYVPLTNVRHYQFEASGFSLGSYANTNSYQVITDTATSFLCGPQANVDSLAKAAGATWDPTNQVYNIPCDADAGPIKLTIGSNNYEIQANNYILKIDTNSCLFAAIPQAYAGFGPSWILGGPFMRQYCNVHDIGKKRVGFALSLTSV
uniref:Peptidase A1 domain-containing protein n=1 Tax=Caenorhabditis japonica TaxID=281687 RepID=A0A8R1I191_CAEJA